MSLLTLTLNVCVVIYVQFHVFVVFVKQDLSLLFHFKTIYNSNHR